MGVGAWIAVGASAWCAVGALVAVGIGRAVRLRDRTPSAVPAPPAVPVPPTGPARAVPNQPPRTTRPAAAQ